jgi:hypothetical protein
VSSISLSVCLCLSAHLLAEKCCALPLISSTHSSLHSLPFLSLFLYFTLSLPPLLHLSVPLTIISQLTPHSIPYKCCRGERNELKREVLAGLVVALATVPTSVAYSSVIGLSPLVRNSVILRQCVTVFVCVCKCDRSCLR